MLLSSNTAADVLSVLMMFILLNSSFCSRRRPPSYSELHSCALSGDLRDEIASYDTVVRDIIDYTMTGPFRRRTYNELEKFVDKFGARLSGSEVLEQAIDYMINITREEGLRDVTTEEVEAPHWQRGEELITMLEPRKKNIAVLGLGYSVSTPPEGITTEVVVVRNFSELAAMDEQRIRGKIVLYDAIFTSYGDTVVYRSEGASKAAEKGAVVSLVRSITPFSINSPHTGMQSYAENVTKIPAAAISIEDADLLRRFQEQGRKIVLTVKLLNSFDKKISRNTIVDYRGTTQPDSLVIVSGHIDSWDVGQGAMDDGGGLFISWAAPVILNNLNLKPKRTIRSIYWTSEELGLIGAQEYAKRHDNETHKINFIMESDEGTFKPRGLEMKGSQEAKCIIAEILKLFDSINATELMETDYPGSDIIVIVSKGIPGASLLNANERYYWFHHTEGDTMNVENPDELDLCAAFWTAVAYVIADLSVSIPKE